MRIIEMMTRDLETDLQDKTLVVSWNEKDDPKAAMSALSFIVASAHAKTVALGELMETLKNLYPEVFEGTAAQTLEN